MFIVAGAAETFRASVERNVFILIVSGIQFSCGLDLSSVRREVSYSIQYFSYV